MLGHAEVPLQRATPARLIISGGLRILQAVRMLDDYPKRRSRMGRYNPEMLRIHRKKAKKHKDKMRAAKALKKTP
jgi:hypothetical protein